MSSSKTAFFRQGLNPGWNHMKFIYRFLANVERQLRLSGWSYRKNFNFNHAWRYNTKLHEPNKRKMGLPCFELSFKGYRDAMIFCVFICAFCLGPTVREQLMRTTSVTIMVFFSKVPFWNYLIIAMFKVLSQELEGPLTTTFETTPYSWGFYGHGST